MYVFKKYMLPNRLHPHLSFCCPFWLKTDKFAASLLRNARDVTTARRKGNCLKIDPCQETKQWFLIPLV